MKYRVTVSTSEERVVEAPNAFEAARRAANGDRSTILDVKQAKGRPTGNMAAEAASRTAGSQKRTRKPMSAATKAKLSKNLAKARAVRKRNVAAAKKAARSRKR